MTLVVAKAVAVGSSIEQYVQIIVKAAKYRADLSCLRPRMPLRVAGVVDCRGLATDCIVLLLQFSFSTLLDEHGCIDAIDDNLVVVVIALALDCIFIYYLQLQ